MQQTISHQKEIKSKNINTLLILPDIIKTIYIVTSVITTCYIHDSNINLKSIYLALELLLFGILCDYIESAVISYIKLKKITGCLDKRIEINIEKLPLNIKVKIYNLLNKHFWTPYKEIRETVMSNDIKYSTKIKPKIEKHSKTIQYLVIGSVIISINIIYFLILHFSNPDSILHIQMKNLYEIIIHAPWIYCFFYFCKLFNDSGLNNFINSKKSKNYSKNI